ncbi:ATP-binding protein [Plantactinospora sp. S1510]|uniref:ATP-binding protein n=1 Tax=Plantactinospora alkalitolerans TaxID=2789879 RepID=A0ABS0H9G7_9ACTN|nr:ATP-binding protein [Plantactinospora alkalitolerans]MBF9135118.1 ATP-binding protein [Plantactinospora alkalitolerans]
MRRWWSRQPESRFVLWLRQRRRLFRTWHQHLQEPASRRHAEQRHADTHWWHRFPWWLLAVGGTVLLLTWVVFSTLMAIFDRPGIGPLRFQEFCSADEPRGYYCGEVKSFLFNLLSAALAITLFVLWRYRRVYRRYRRRALAEPHRMVPTAGRGIDRIVGRDDLCRLLIQRLRDRRDQRPLLLVGGVGTGKTVTLVQLAAMLAEHGVLPIGIDLGTVDPGTRLDFLALARKRLQEVTDAWLWAEGDADRIWRYLLRENRIAVLADGLDEARPRDPSGDRDSAIRAAIQQAVEVRLPLVVASRPHDPLRGLDAFLLQLEPLSEGAAMEYVSPLKSKQPGWERIIRLVKAADIADSPAYLRIIRDLRESGHLDDLADDAVAHAHADRAAVRWRLLQLWRTALVDGAVQQDYGLPERERADAVEMLSALACVGLARGSLSVRIADLIPADGAPATETGLRGARVRPTSGSPRTAPGWTSGNPERRHGSTQGDEQNMAAVQDCLIRALRSRLRRLNPANAQDVGLAVTTGRELGIVICQEDEIRFQHGVIQAYLGARLLDAVLPPFHRTPAERQPDSERQSPPERQAGPESRWFFLSLALGHGSARELLAALTLYSCSAAGDPSRQETARQVVDRLRDAAVEWSTPVDVQRGEVKIFGGDRTKAVETFAAALDIDSRLAESQHRQLVDLIAMRWPDLHEDHSITDRPLEEAKQVLIRRFGAAAQLLDSRRRAGESDLPQPEYPRFFQMIHQAASSYRIRLTAVHEIARLGPGTVRGLSGWSEPAAPVAGAGPPGGPSPSARSPEERQMLAWLAPLHCIHSGGDNRPDDHEAARQNLRHWLDLLTRHDTEDRIIDEMNLAQGFRLAANCRVPEDRSAHRLRLVQHAETALRHSRFWYSQLALVQALTLLSLPEDPRRRLPAYGPATDPRGLVDFWLSIAGGGADAPAPDRPHVHPFVRQAGDLCVQALQSGHPERHCWVDEQDIVRRIGSYTTQSSIRRYQDSWCPEAVGWMVLTKQAQRLLADVMLLLNLADRPDSPPAERARRLLQANRGDLPPCLTVDPTPMQPGRNSRASRPAEPGSTCLGDCPYRLCPLPPQSDGLAYPMDEVFCARQIDLVAARWRGLSGSVSWFTSRHRTQWFWREMSQRMLPSWRK